MFQVLIYKNVNQKQRNQNWVLSMHPVHAQPSHFLAYAPIFLQILEEQYGSPQGVGHDVPLIYKEIFLKI